MLVKVCILSPIARPLFEQYKAVVVFLPLYFFPAVKNFLKITPVSQKNICTLFFPHKFLGNHGSVDLYVNNSQMCIWFKLLDLNK